MKTTQINNDDFLDFDEDILENFVSKNYSAKELIFKFKQMRKPIPTAFDKLSKNAEKQPVMNKKELEKEIGL